MTYSRYVPGKSYGGTTTPFVQPKAPVGPRYPSAPSQAATGLAGAAQRGMPERVPGQGQENWLMNVAGFAAQQPAGALERPLSYLNIATRDKGQPGTGLIDKAAAALGGIRFGPELPGQPKAGTLGQAFDTLNSGLEFSGNLFPSVINAGDAMTLRKIKERGLGPTDLLFKGAPSASRTGVLVKGQDQNVADFLASLDKRGFFDSVDANGNPQKLTVDDLIKKMDDHGALGAFQFGDKAVTNDALSNGLIRLGLDPVNLAFFAAAPLKALTIARWGKVAIDGGEVAARLAEAGPAAFGAAATIGGRGATAVRGIGYMDDMVNLGHRVAQLPSVMESAVQIAKGNTAAGTIKGLGVILGKAGKAVFLPGKGSLGLRYARGAVRQQAGWLATDFISSLGRQTDPQGNVIESGPLSALHDLSQNILNDKPLSSNQAFVLLAAIGLPYGELTSEAKAGARGLLGRTTGSGRAARWAREFTPGEGSLLHPVRAGVAQETKMYEALGQGDVVAGKAEFAKLQDYMDLQQAFDRMATNPRWKMEAKSLDQALGEGGAYIGILKYYTKELKDLGVITDKSSLSAFQQWGRDFQTSVQTADGEIIHHVSKGGFDLTPQGLIDQWTRYSRANAEIAANVAPLAGTVLGRVQNMTFEGVDALIAAVTDATRNGKVSVNFVKDTLIQYPAMFTDTAIPQVTREFFGSLMNEGVAGGARKVGYDSQTLIDHLTKLRDKAAPKASEMFHEANAAESKVINDVPQSGGPITSRGIQQLFTSKEIKAHQLRSASDGRAALKETERLKAKIAQVYNKRGTALKSDAVIEAKASELMHKSIWDGGATFDPITGEYYDPAKGGYSVGSVDGTYATVNANEGAAVETWQTMNTVENDAAFEALAQAKSARFEPDWSSDGLGVTRSLTIGDTHYPAKFDKTGPADGHVVKEYETGEGPGLGVMAYGPDGQAVGFFSGLLKGKDKGAFKIVVDPAFSRQGIGSRILDAAEQAGFDIEKSIKKNTFTSEGRALVKSWLEKKSAPAGTLYHGTKSAGFSKFDESRISDSSLYGPGVYLTDSETIAAGYSKTKAGTGPGSVLQVQANAGKLVDLQKPFPADLAKTLKELEATSDSTGMMDAVAAIEAGKTGHEVYQAFKGGLESDGLTKAAALEELQGFNQAIQLAGYDGLTHIGGVGKDIQHQVTIVFDATKPSILPSSPKVAPGEIEQMAKISKRIAREYPGDHVGTWLNPDTGLIEVDPSTVIGNKAEALKVARERGQKTIYDHANGTTIDVPGVHNPPTWAHPGPKPVRPYDPEKATVEQTSAHYSNVDRWTRQMSRGISMGKLDPEVARAAGWDNPGGYHDFTPMPETMYHATTHADEVMAKGLKNRDELTDGLRNSSKGSALGGGGGAVSFTTDKGLADRIAETLIEGKKVITGEITPEELIARARAGGFEDKMYLYSHKYAGAVDAAEGKFNLNQVIRKHMEIKRAELGHPRTIAEMPAGSEPRLDSLITIDGIDKYVSWWQPITDQTTIDENLFDMYRGFLAAQDKIKGMPEDPLFFSPDVAHIKSLQESQVKTLTVHPLPKSVGWFQSEAEREWRTYSGDAVTIEGGAGAGRQPDLTSVPQRFLDDKNALAFARSEVDRVKRSLMDLKQRAAEVGLEELHYTFRNSDGTLSVTGESLDRVMKQKAYADANFPDLYEIKKAPVFHVPWSAADSAVGAIYTQRTTLGKLLFDYGPLSKFSRFVDYLVEPQSAFSRSSDAKRMMYSTLQRHGASEEEVTMFMNDMAETAHRLGTTGPMRVRVARGLTSLTPSQIEMSAAKVWPAGSAVSESVRKQFGGVGAGMHWYKIIDRSSNNLVRVAESQVLKDGKVFSGQNMLAKIFRAGYGFIQDAPVIGAVSRATRFIDKTIYPLVRFQLSPRWQAMNLLENDLIGIMQDGIKASRFSKFNQTESGTRLYEMAKARTQGTRLGQMLSDPQVVGDFFLPDTGVIAGHWMDPVMRRQFAIGKDRTLTQILDELPTISPEHKWFVDHFGANKGSWSTQIEDMLTSWDKKGTKATLQQEANTVALQDKWTPQERAQIQPFMQRLEEAHAQLYEDIAHIHLGDTSRSRLERLANSYWLYWPISYQIKTTRWMLDLMTNRAFGVKTNLGGAWLLDHGRQQISNLMQNSPEFRKQIGENDTAWMLANMMFPAVPWDQAVSLSRIPRYIGGNVLHWWPEYPAITSPLGAAKKAMELGPFYDTELGIRIQEQYFPPAQPDTTTQSIQPYK